MGVCRERRKGKQNQKGLGSKQREKTPEIKETENKLAEMRMGGRSAERASKVSS